jgi:hypothetical protein
LLLRCVYMHTHTHTHHYMISHTLIHKYVFHRTPTPMTSSLLCHSSESSSNTGMAGPSCTTGGSSCHPSTPFAIGWVCLAKGNEVTLTSTKLYANVSLCGCVCLFVGVRACLCICAHALCVCVCVCATDGKTLVT